MSAVPQKESILLPGPAGQLEALVERPRDGDVVSAAVVCHPHPLHGGTMLNKVAHTLARAFLDQQCLTLRFNFRGTGKSEGQHDDGVGEVEDVKAALEWVRQTTGVSAPWLGGFSFGAAVAIKTAGDEALSGLVSIAPAVRRFASGLQTQPECPWLVVTGDQDELVDVDDTIDWVNSLQPGPELEVMTGAEHFFHGRLVELRSIIAEFVADSSR